MIKKKVLFIFIVLPVFSFSSAPGTCSWHGGVDCSAGFDLDGSAICVDGWRDSSENFFDVDLCKDFCSVGVYEKVSKAYNGEI